MNPDDYDNEGNNIVPCPICLDVHCPSKEDGKCPEEDMFALEAEIRTLLDEYKATNDNSRIANVLEAVEKIITQDRTSIHSSLVAAVEGSKLTKEDYEKSDFATYPDFCAHMYTHNATVTKTLTIINSIFKE